MPISADQWRAVTGLNNVRRPRQVGIKPRYVQQEPDNEKLPDHPEPDSKQDTTRRRARSRKSRIKKEPHRKDRSRPERDKEKESNDSISSNLSRTILYLSMLVLCLAVIIPSLDLTVCGTNINSILTPGPAAVISGNSTIPVISSVMGFQLVQSFISVVVMLLLLLSGDIETNPGPDMMWSKRLYLKVCFINPEVLEDEGWMYDDAPMNVGNILAWAHQWNSNAFPDIPKFYETHSRKKADIRVRLGGDGCWSKIGTDAKTVVDKSEPTMNLALKGQGPEFQKFLVMNTFGHSLGLRNEHQHPDFWKVASKLLDVDKMKADPQWKNVDVDANILALPPRDLQCKQFTEKKYDPDSVMHYGFDVGWLKDKKHRTLEGVRSDTNLTREEMKVLEGIHKRNRSFTFDGPSKMDLVFLQECYAASDWMQTEKMWGKRDKHLKVYFINPEVLEDEGWMCGDAPMNVDNIFAWAQQWNSNAFPDIPKFEYTHSAKKAHIRVYFGDVKCWSKIGTDARAVNDITKPTMNLALKGQNPDFQMYLVIHQFGHALGLEHEHQRPVFWKVASDFVDIGKMKADPQLKNVNVDEYMLVLPLRGPFSLTKKYDPDSVMHYWFDVHWLKDKKHWTLEGVRSDNNLTREEMKVLEGIHKRHRSFKVDGPSKMDLEFLQEYYGSNVGQESDHGIVLSVDTHLRHVKNSLLGAANQWRDIGQTLNLIPRTLRSIGRSHHDNDSECLNEVLAKWMHSGKATIDQLLEALEDPAVQRNDIAAEIRALKGDKRNRVGLPPDLEPEHNERDKYLDKLDEMMKAEDKIDVRYVKLYFIGMSGLGKTTFRKRLMGLITNINSLPPEERQRCSTLLAECTQVLAVLSGSKLELKVSEDVDEETKLLFQYLYSGRTGQSSTEEATDQAKKQPSPNPPDAPNDSKGSGGEETSRDGLGNQRTSGEKHLGLNKDSNSPPPSAEGRSEADSKQQDEPGRDKISKIFTRLRGVVGSGDYAKELLGKILLNLIDMGGQPGFLEMLPFLSTGPGMYLVFFPMDKELDEQYEVSYERDGDSITPYKAKYTIEETLAQILSAVSSMHTMCDPVTENWLKKKLKSPEFLDVKPIASLVGTFKDEVERRIQKDKLRENLCDKLKQSHPEVEDQKLKNELEMALDIKLGPRHEQGSTDSEPIVSDKLQSDIKTAIENELGKESFQSKVQQLIDSELQRKHKSVGEIGANFGGLLSKPPVPKLPLVESKDRTFFEVDNFKGTQADIDPIREHLNQIFNGQLEKAKLPIRPAQLLFGIILRKEYDIVTLDECYEIGDELKMGKEDVEFTLRYLHHCVGALLYYPDCEDSSNEDQNNQNGDMSTEDQGEAHDRESDEKSWFKKNVICSPQVVFDSTSGLIVKALRELPSASIVDRVKKSWTEKGQFSLETINLCLKKDGDLEKQVEDRKIIPAEKLILLLKHVNLLSPISKMVDGKEVTTYFMPAVLECASKEDLLLRPKVDDDNPAPLLITFERGYVPIGLFCAMVTRLVSKGCQGILGVKWELLDSAVKRNFVSFQIGARHEVTLISHVRCYELRVTKKGLKVDLSELCKYVLSTVLVVLKEISVQAKPQVAFECLCEKHQATSTETRGLRELCKPSEGIHTSFRCENGAVDLHDSQQPWIAKDAQLCGDAQLKVFPFTDDQCLSDLGFTFTWKGNREGSGNELSIEKVTPEDCTGYYSCEVSKNGTPYFTSYHSLKQCMMSFSIEMSCDDVCMWLKQNDVKDKDVKKFEDDDIDGGSFIKLPSDEGKLRQELKLTRGGTDKVANLLSKIQTHQPGPELKKEKHVVPTDIDLEAVDDSTKLIEEDNADITRELDGLESDYYCLGLCLHLLPGTVSRIHEESHHNCRTALSKVIIEWLQLNYTYQEYGRPSWKYLVRALCHPNMGDKQKLAKERAEAIAEKHPRIQ